MCSPKKKEKQDDNCVCEMIYVLTNFIAVTILQYTCISNQPIVKKPNYKL